MVRLEVWTSGLILTLGERVNDRKEVYGEMNKYEVLYILGAGLDDSVKEAQIEKYS